jgi:hypothetical protein
MGNKNTPHKKDTSVARNKFIPVFLGALLISSGCAESASTPPRNRASNTGNPYLNRISSGTDSSAPSLQTSSENSRIARESIFEESPEAALKAKAIEGDTESQYKIGKIYLYGEDLSGKKYKTNHKEALTWLEKAANKGHALAIYHVGLIYSEGLGVSADPSQAVTWFKRSADKGHADSQNTLGVCYLEGRGTPEDYKEALRYFKKAANNGNAFAMYNLGLMYSKPLGVEQDLEEASHWYRSAAKLGHSGAIEYLKNAPEIVATPSPLPQKTSHPESTLEPTPVPNVAPSNPTQVITLPPGSCRPTTAPDGSPAEECVSHGNVSAPPATTRPTTAPPTSTNYKQYIIARSKWGTDGWYYLWLKNTSNTKLWVRVRVLRKDGTYGPPSLVTLKPGEEDGGAYGGLWYTDAHKSGRYQWCVMLPDDYSAWDSCW